MIMDRSERRVALDEPNELFHAHLEVLVHLLRDEVRWNGSAHEAPAEPDAQDAGNGAPQPLHTGRVTRYLRGERLRLLHQQRATLEREARLRVMGERLVSHLEDDPGLETRDALAVAWFYRSEVEPRRRHRRAEDTGASPRHGRVHNGTPQDLTPENATMECEALLREVGDAHARLLNGVDAFLPSPLRSRASRGFPMAVAVAATRLARREKGSGETTWMDVEPLARRILRATVGRGVAATPA